MVVEFTASKKTVTAVVGTPLSQLCAKNGVKVRQAGRQAGKRGMVMFSSHERYYTCSEASFLLPFFEVKPLLI